jgi:hypothetical protein
MMRSVEREGEEERGRNLVSLLINSPLHPKHPIITY